jgi:VIT1/CCC1 family predicted Fe2+/Mn2+ transporter
MYFNIKRPIDYLFPHEWLLEIIYGLIIALAITNAVRAIAGPGTIDIDLMAETALGAGIAWGIIDAILYILIVVYEKNRYARISSMLKGTSDDREALGIIQEDLEDSIVGTVDAEDQEAVYKLVLDSQRRSGYASNGRAKTIKIMREDLFGATQVFLAMLAATLVVVLPLWLIEPPTTAVLVSNAVALVSLFMVGYAWARHTNIPRTRFGLILVVIGAAIIGITLVLGG